VSKFPSLTVTEHFLASLNLDNLIFDLFVVRLNCLESHGVIPFKGFLVTLPLIYFSMICEFVPGRHFRDLRLFLLLWLSVSNISFLSQDIPLLLLI
jgi:hypothetical protein